MGRHMFRDGLQGISYVKLLYVIWFCLREKENNLIIFQVMVHVSKKSLIYKYRQRNVLSPE